MSGRRGIVLLEVILAMSVATVLIGGLAVVVSRVMLSNAATQQHLRTIVTLGHLGEQFRRDAHAAHSATIEDHESQPARLTFQGDDRRSVEYQITPAGLQRVAATADAADRHELFALPGMQFLGWKTDEDSRAVSLLVGRLARPETDDPTLGGRFSIDARLAKTESSPAASE